VVKISVTWVMALAMARGTPNASKLLVASTPNAMPKSPWTSCTQKPMTTKIQISGNLAPQGRAFDRYRRGAPCEEPREAVNASAGLELRE